MEDVRRVQFRFYIGVAFTNDAMTIGLMEGTSINRFAFNPRRDSAVDAPARAYVTYGGNEYALGSSSLDLNNWHLMDLHVNVASNEVRVTIT
jgi:hypothetical protein